MKNLKKLLAVIIAIAMMATMMVPAFAEGEISADAQTCENLGVLLGEGSGVTSEYLAKETVRLQAAIIFLRLLGKDQEALAYDEWEDNFTDADQVNWAGGRNVLAYLKANPDLGWVGNPDGSFDPNGKASAQMIYKVLLEALGYKAKVGDSEDYDFDWAGTIEFAADKGLSKIADAESVTNDDLAVAIVEALKTETKEGGKTLIEKLVEDGIVDKAKAIEEGLIADELKVDVKATAANVIEVTANKAFDPATAKFEVKLGFVPQDVTVTYSEDKKTAILTSEANFVAGDYTVIAEGIETPLKIEAQKMVSFTITTEVLTAESAAQPIKYAAVDQYGNVFDYASTNFTATAVNISDGGSVSITGNGNEFSIAALNTLKDKKVLVTITHNSDGISQS
ncbi:MAG TPA: hypothetical protein GXX14_13635, partial [Clostridiaceae bacterium]|nr:hypothetical protein [Clostridiaceae bacterium]